MTRSPFGAQMASRTCSNTSRGAPPESAARASVGFAASGFNKSAISFEADTPPTRTRSSPKGWGCGNSARVENRSRISEHVRSVWERETEHIRSEEHTSELQSRLHLVCRLLLEKKKN